VPKYGITPTALGGAMSIILGMSNATYHQHPAIGSSTAKLALRSLRLVKDTIDGLAKPETVAQQVGTIFHGLILEPDRILPNVVDHGPINPKTGCEYGRDTKKWEEWAIENPTAVFLDDWMRPSLDRMPSAVSDLLLIPCDSEVSVFVDGTQFRMKARPDRLYDKLIIDLKSIDNIDSIDRSIDKYSYWFSGSWYRRVLFMETGVHHDFVLIFAEKNPPYRWRIVDLDDAYRKYGDEKVTDVIGQIGQAFASGNWEDQDDIRILATFPEWKSDSINIQYDESEA